MKSYLPMIGVGFGLLILSGPGFSQEMNQSTLGVPELKEADVKALSNFSLSEESIKTGKELETLLRQRGMLEQVKATKNWTTNDFQRNIATFHSKGTEVFQRDLSFVWSEIKKIQKGHDDTKRPTPKADPPEKKPVATTSNESLDPTGALVLRLSRSLARDATQADKLVSYY